MPIQIEILAKAAAANASPPGPDLTDWIQALSSLIALLAVAGVAWIEHRRAKTAAAEAKASEISTEVALLSSMAEMCASLLQAWYLGFLFWSRAGKSRETLSSEFDVLARRYRLFDIALKRQLTGRPYSVETLIVASLVEEIVSTYPAPPPDPSAHRALSDWWKPEVDRIGHLRKRCLVRIAELTGESLEADRLDQWFMDRRSAIKSLALSQPSASHGAPAVFPDESFVPE